MSANLIEILITAKDLADPAMDRATAKAKGFGGVMGEMGKVAAAALVGIAAESVHMATEYESSTTRLVTSAGEQQKNLELVRKGMLDMAGQVGVSAIDLSKAMYYVESAGFHGADALKALKAAAQGAAAEGADTTTVVKAMTDVLVDYHLTAASAADVTSKMITAVSFGKTSLQEFSGAFASIVPAASAAGISFNDVAAALAEMTNHGFTANRASQNLAQALRSLLNPTGPMKKAFDEFGVSSDTLKAKLAGPNGLTDAMQYLATKAEKAGKEGTPAFAAALKLLMGTAPGANAALATVGENFDATSKAIKGIGSASTDAQGNVKGFAEMQDTLGQKTKELRAAFDTLMIELGNKLIPVFKSVTDALLNHHELTLKVIVALAALTAGVVAVSAAMKVAGAAAAVWTAGTKVAAAAQWLFNDACIGTRIGLAALAIQEYATAVASKAAAAAQWLFNAAMDANPIGAVILALAALGVAIYELVTHWKQATEFVKKYSTEIELALIGILGPLGLVLAAALYVSLHWRQIWGDIKQVASDFKQWLWNDFGAKIADFFTQTIPRWFHTAVGAIGKAWSAVYDTVVAPVKRIYDDVMGLIQSMIGGVEQLLGLVNGNAGNIGAAVGSAAGSILQGVKKGGGHPGGQAGMATGGVVGAAAGGGVQGGWTRMNEDGIELVRLPTGATVIPHSNVAGMAASGALGGRASAVSLEVVPGGDSAFEQFMIFALRNWVRARAGASPNSVQKVLGQG